MARAEVNTVNATEAVGDLLLEASDLLAAFTGDVKLDPRVWRQLLTYVPRAVLMEALR